MSSQDGAPLNIPGLVKKQGLFVFFKAHARCAVFLSSTLIVKTAIVLSSMCLDVPWRLKARGGWPTTCALARKRSSSSILGRRFVYRCGHKVYLGPL